MHSHDESKTCSTLLRRVAVAPRDETAWTEFVDRYGKKILRWCCDRGLQDADALDVSQLVLGILAVKLRGFTYDPTQSFRGYLRKITNDAVCDAFQSRRRNAAPLSESIRMLSDIEARDDLVRRLENDFDLELLDEAKRLVQERVAAQTWQAYQLTAEEELSGAEAAARLGISVERVFVAKGRVLKMLKEEVRKLDVT
jgi:RNA polymerase sigma factor (sigma-70 family)